MLTLLLKTDQSEAEIYLYQENKCIAEKVWKADRSLAETISKQIESVIKKEGLSLDKLDAIGVFRGPGSFTGLRIGHSVANALAYGLGLPIVGVQGKDWQKQAILLLEEGKDEEVVMPEYGAPPRTTAPRK